MTDLHEILSLATDRVEPTGGAAAALATARRRRRTRRGAAASAAVVVLVAGVAAVGQLDGGAPQEPEPAPPVQTVEPTPWDPSRSDELPAAAEDVAPLLPAVLRVPDIAPRIEDEPMEAAVLSVDDDADVLLLGTDGRWHCVVVADRTDEAPVLSPDGTRLAVGVAGGFEVIDLTTGDRTFRTRVPDFESEWTLPLPPVRGPVGWSVRPVAELDDGTGLLWTGPGPRDPGGWRIVHWDPASGDLSLVTRTSSSPAKATSFAGELLGES